MDKGMIISLKLRGKSNREISAATGIDRKTIAKYWKAYCEDSSQLDEATDVDDISDIQDRLLAKPRYDTSSRKPVKYTEELDRRVDEILQGEFEKDRVLGRNKQHLTDVQIHQIVTEEGFDIGRSTLSEYIRKKRKRHIETFIRQEYELGDRLEYDFGEIKLVINGITRKYYLAVFGAPAAGFRWAYIYDSMKKEVFMDSHVRFFEMVGGVYREVVYDNMKNVVHKFIGKTEKELNPDLINMSMYYGFDVNVTNCFRGNEKGYVEGSVKEIRKKAFAKKYRFNTIEEAEKFLLEVLNNLNAESMIEEEKRNLLPWKPPLELALLTRQVVDKYSFIKVENNFYSVPEHLTGHTVDVKNYLRKIVVYANHRKICEHKKVDGFNKMQVDIYHYLDTLSKKPGALKNSKALKSRQELKAIYDTYFTERPKEFIELLRKNSDCSYEELQGILKAAGKTECAFRSDSDSNINSEIDSKAMEQIEILSQMYLKGGNEYVH